MNPIQLMNHYLDTIINLSESLFRCYHKSIF